MGLTANRFPIVISPRASGKNKGESADKIAESHGICNCSARRCSANCATFLTLPSRRILGALTRVRPDDFQERSYCRHFTVCGFAGNHAVFLSFSFGVSGLTNGAMLKDSLGRCRGTSARSATRIGESCGTNAQPEMTGPRYFAARRRPAPEGGRYNKTGGTDDHYTT